MSVLLSYGSPTRDVENMNLGVDIGRVIIAPADGRHEDTSFVEGTVDQALATPPYESLFDVLPKLVRYFNGRVWLVSKARKPVQEKTRLWLAHQRFFERTGIAPHNLRFCRARDEKAQICRELNITHFIDDRREVLRHMNDIVEHRYLFGPQRDEIPADLVHIESWTHAVSAIVGVAR